MDPKYPRFSTSEHLLGVALEHARTALGAEARMIRLNDLKFRNCEGYYSKAAKACTWPCSITSMDKTDQLEQVYEMAVHWADILLIATPIRWGAASSLYYKMVERMNCIQNQITHQQQGADPQQGGGLHHHRRPGRHPVRGRADDDVLQRDRLSSCRSSRSSRTRSAGSSRRWTATWSWWQNSEPLRAGARELVNRSAEMANCLLEREITCATIERGGRKASA